MWLSQYRCYISFRVLKLLSIKSIMAFFGLDIDRPLTYLYIVLEILE